jgi:hypothetical protein
MVFRLTPKSGNDYKASGTRDANGVQDHRCEQVKRIGYFSVQIPQEWKDQVKVDQESGTLATGESKQVTFNVSITAGCSGWGRKKCHHTDNIQASAWWILKK